MLLGSGFGRWLGLRGATGLRLALVQTPQVLHLTVWLVGRLLLVNSWLVTARLVVVGTGMLVLCLSCHHPMGERAVV